MDSAYEILLCLILAGCKICIVSMGTLPNLKGKEIWLKNHIPNFKNTKNIEFIGCDLDRYKDKSHIDMSDGILIDDEVKNLNSSNAKLKICFGDKYNWNESWAGIRCFNWYDIKRFLSTEWKVIWIS